VGNNLSCHCSYIISPFRRSHLDIAGGECTSDAAVHHTEDTVWHDAIDDRWRRPAATYDTWDWSCAPDPGMSVCLESPWAPRAHPWLPPGGKTNRQQDMYNIFYE